MPITSISVNIYKPVIPFYTSYYMFQLLAMQALLQVEAALSSKHSAGVGSRKGLAYSLVDTEAIMPSVRAGSIWIWII